MTKLMMTSVWSSTFVASLVLPVMQASVTLALSLPYSHLGSNYHCPSFTTSRYSHAHHHHMIRSRSRLQSMASNNNDTNGGFFGEDDSGGNFFEEEEKQQQKQQQPPPVSSTSSPQEKEDETPLSLEELEMLATPFDEHLPKINTVTLVGRVGQSPEPRYFDDGKVVLNLSLAVRRKYHPLERKVRNIRSGDEETDWFTLEFWGRDAEYVTNYVEKGARLGVTGSLVVDGWMDKATGEQRRKPKIIVRHTDILESRAEAELRKGNKGSYNGGGSSGGNSYGGGNGSGGGKTYGDDDDGGPSPAGTGGFFS